MIKLYKYSFLFILALIPQYLFSVIADFRQGQFPTVAYAGAIDAQIVGGTSSTNNYGTLTSMSIDNNNTTYSGGPPSWTMLRFDISSIPAFSIINSATLTLQVTNPSAGSYQLYEVLRNWTEAGVSFNSFNGVSNWTTAGCNGIGTDRNNIVLVNTITGSTGSHSLILNAAGIAVIQAWVNSPANNFGFIFQGTSTDGYDFNSKEHGTVNTRPRLTIDYTGTLPIELLNFNAFQKKSEVEVNWKTTYEKNNKLFMIERSKNTSEWVVIGIKNGAGNSNTVNNYSITDMEPLSGLSYYRLKQIDFNNDSSYSEITFINFNDNKENIILSPNPFNEIINISGLNGYEEIILFDANGKQVIYLNNSVFHEAILPTKELSSGLYYLEIKDKNGSTYKKLIK